MLLNSLFLNGNRSRAAVAFTGTGGKDQGGHKQQGEVKSFVFHIKYVRIKTA